MSCVAPTQGYLVRSYGPVVGKPLIEDDWTGSLECFSSNDACMWAEPFSFQAMALFGMAWSE